MSFWQGVSRGQRKVWKLGATVIAGGAFFKYCYFNLSRGYLVDNMDKRHIKSHQHLEEARKFAEWSEKDRQARTPDLTEAQHKQLQAYLDIRRELQEEQLMGIEQGTRLTPVQR